MQITTLLAFGSLILFRTQSSLQTETSLLPCAQPQGSLSLEKVPEQIYSNLSLGSENGADAFSA